MATASAERSRFRHGVERGVGNAPARFPDAPPATPALPRCMGEPNPPPPNLPNPPNPSEAFAPSDAWLPRPPNEKLAVLSPALRPAPREPPPTGLNGDDGGHEIGIEPVSENAGPGPGLDPGAGSVARPSANPSVQPILGRDPAGAAASSPGDSESGCGSD